MGRKKKKRVLAILPESIGGRLTTSSLIAGFEQNDCKVTVYDELFEKNLSEVLKNEFDTHSRYCHLLFLMFSISYSPNKDPYIITRNHDSAYRFLL